MLTGQQRQETVTFLHGLRRATGGYGDAPGKEAAIQPTVAALKALIHLGATPEDPDGVVDFILRHWEPSCGGFRDEGTDEPSAFASAMALVALHDLGASSELQRCLSATMTFIASLAQTREEHFMTLGAFEECGVAGAAPERSVSYFRGLRTAESDFGPSALANAMAVSALLRVGEDFEPKEPVIERLSGAQKPDGGFADSERSDLWTTYCVMRALDLLEVLPDVLQVVNYVRSLAAVSGGLCATRSAPPTASATYQGLSTLDWCIRPVMRAARRGDLAKVKAWLAKAGDTDLQDLKGWTPLLLAAASGRSTVVEHLLHPGDRSVRPADARRRLASADASATFLAGQSGDPATVKALLAATPESLFDVCGVNGGTLLLQTAFYGSERHRSLALYLLEDIAEILHLPKGDAQQVRSARRRMMVQTNIRGVNATETARMWANASMLELFTRYDETTPEERRQYLDELLRDAAAEVTAPTEPGEREAQSLTERILSTISEGLTRMERLPEGATSEIEQSRSQTLAALRSLVSDRSCQIDRLGGPLGQPPLVATLTDGSRSPHAAALRFEIASYLLEHGADPKTRERHPMAVGAVIRAAVLNHFDLLRLVERYMKPLAFAWELNLTPAINGQTALLDSVHRALTAPEEALSSHLEQIRWEIAHGARRDIQDHTGQTPEQLARNAANDAVFQSRAGPVLHSLGL